MGIGETPPLLREFIEVRGWEFFGAITAQVAIPEIVGVDDDDIRAGLRAKAKTQETKEQGIGAFF